MAEVWVSSQASAVRSCPWLLLLLVGRSLVVELPGGECGVVAGGSGAKAAVEALALALRKEVALLGRERPGCGAGPDHDSRRCLRCVLPTGGVRVGGG